MNKQQRRTHRTVGKIFISVLLRDGTEGPILAGPVPALLHDISPEGAGLSMSQVRLGDYHVFYSPREEVSNTLQIEIPLSGEKDEVLSLPARPVWFDRGATDDVMPFQLGVEFLLDPAGERLPVLKKWIRQQHRKGRAWWRPRA
jgi:hypothetical protein